MTSILDPLTPEQADRIVRLGADLKRFAAGKQPTEEELDEAPSLLLWTTAWRPALCLDGICSDHPSIESGHVVTSEVWWIDPSLEWCRTSSRIYRLGKYFPKQ